MTYKAYIYYVKITLQLQNINVHIINHGSRVSNNDNVFLNYHTYDFTEQLISSFIKLNGATTTACS